MDLELRLTTGVQLLPAVPTPVRTSSGGERGDSAAHPSTGTSRLAN
jgi:hypothetical protein